MTEGPAIDPKVHFHNQGYLDINAARLAHLAFVVSSLRLPLKGMRVIELGAGIGDHSGFWLERGCRLTITEPRPENLAVLRDRYPDSDIRAYDLDRDPVPDERFDIVYAYGLLYHLADPARGLAAMGKLAGQFLFLETCVSFGDALEVNPVEEEQATPTQAVTGHGCRPTRPWLFAELGRHFPHIYQPGTQPDHPQFPNDWRKGAPRGLTRSTFVASRRPLHVPTLFPRVLNRQARYRPVAGGKPGLDRLIAAMGVAAVLDVGANLGQFAGRLRAGGFAGAITSFEPLREAFAGLSRAAADDPAWSAHRFALGAREEEARINVSANLFSSSLLTAEPRTLAAEPQVGTVARQKVTVRRLDGVWPELPDAARRGPVLLKIDVQGFEGAVLDGAAGVLDKIDAVLLECSLVPVYAGEPVLADTLARMRGLGFYPVWIEPGWSDGDTGQVYQCDVLFSRSPDVPRS